MRSAYNKNLSYFFCVAVRGTCMAVSGLLCSLEGTLPTTIPCSKALKYVVFSVHPLNGTHTQSMSQLSQGLKKIFNLSPPSSTLTEVTSIRDHSFHLDSPGQSMSWKEQVFLMFCILRALFRSRH